MRRAAGALGCELEHQALCSQTPWLTALHGEPCTVPASRLRGPPPCGREGWLDARMGGAERPDHRQIPSSERERLRGRRFVSSFIACLTYFLANLSI